MKRRACFFLALLLSLFSLCSCGGGDAKENTVRVFYLNAEKNALLTGEHVLEAESAYGQAGELLDLLEADGPDIRYAPPVSGFACRDFSIEEGTITVEFSSEYRSMDVITEKLTRAAIVNTLCGVESIRRVTIRVNGALLIDDRGNKSENMTADQFIYNSGSEMLNFERAEMHLYFADAEGKKLVETYRTVVFNGNIPLEKLVVEQIIAGPNGDFNYPTLNENTKIINIVTRDNICSVTFDRTFLQETYPVTPEVAIYSIVNSLTELPAIRQVQIIVEGVEDPVLLETFSFDSETLFQKNTTIVQTRE